jgi:apolipoprotein N-acyltransferase
VIAIVCTLLSAAGFYFSLGLGDQWWLAWIAPAPVLWFAFGRTNAWVVFLLAFFAFALGGTSFLRAYAGLLPTPVLILAICGPALAFATSVVASQRVQRTLGPVAAMFAFAAIWTAFDFLSSFSRGGGSVATPAASEVGAPIFIQGASFFGYLAITFLLGVVAAGIALSARNRDPVPVALAFVLFAANAVYGYVRISTPPNGDIRVALIDSDDAFGPTQHEDRTKALADVDAYVAQIAKLRSAHVNLIVLPENIAMLAAPWRDEAQAKLAGAANDVGATLVAGFNTNLDGAQRNISWSFVPGSAQPVTYMKRRLVPVLETSRYTPGPGPKILASGIGLEICKDMDFDRMIRADEIATRPELLAVPAWDFEADNWSHARVAVLRSVENGVPMARSARDGLLTLNDRYGRIVAAARTRSDFRTLIGNLPLAGRGGDTLYDRIGDTFGWFSIVLSLGLLGWSFMPRRNYTLAGNS